MVQLSIIPNTSSLYESIIDKYIKFKKVNNVILEMCYHIVLKSTLKNLHMQNLQTVDLKFVYQGYFGHFFKWGDDVFLHLVWTGSRQVAY